jgi:hypothetical protein
MNTSFHSARWSFLLLQCCMLAVLAACGVGSASGVVGKWQVTRDSVGAANFANGYEFTREGRVIVYVREMSVKGTPQVSTYKVEGNRIFIDRPLGSALVYEFSLGGNTLTLQQPGGASFTMRKVTFDPVHYEGQKE